MCVKPILVRTESRLTGCVRYVDAPCGTCIECLKRRQNDWKLRICKECDNWQYVYFFTLTYRNDMLPVSLVYEDVAGEVINVMRYNDFTKKYAREFGLTCKSTTYKKDVQDWFKRMREQLTRMRGGERFKCKYFICSEYGPNPSGTKRPHYHGILMCNEDYNTLLPFFNEWRDKYGRIDFKRVGCTFGENSKVANYISKYCAKGCFESRKEDISNGHIDKAWYLMSKNIGLDWLLKNKQQWLKYVPLAHAMSEKMSYCSYDDVVRFFKGNTDMSTIIAKEIDALLDNLYVYDGESFRYKLPRYYKERLFCKTHKFSRINGTDKQELYPILDGAEFNRYGLRTPLAFAYFPQPITYESKVVEDTRYISETFLSCAMAYRLQLRFSNRYIEDERIIREKNPTLADSDVFRIIEARRERSLLACEENSTRKLRDFYEQNMWSHREFDFDELNFFSNI